MPLPEPRIKIDIETKTFVRFWLVVISFGIFLAILWSAMSALIVVFTAFFLAIVLNRPVAFLAKYIKSRAAAAIIVILGCLSAIILAFATIVPILFTQIANFATQVPGLIETAQGQLSGPVNDFVVNNNLDGHIDEIMGKAKVEAGNFAINSVEVTIASLGGLIGSLFGGMVIFVLIFFMLIEGSTWMDRYWRLVYSDKKTREQHKLIANKMYNVVSGYVSGTIVLALISAALTAVGVLVVSIFFPISPSMAIPFAVIMFITAFIPMFGAFIGGIIIAIIMALYNLPATIIFMIWFMIYQQIENNILVPKVFSKHVNISPLVVLVAITIGTYCGGFMGVLLAIPVAGCAQVLLLEYLERTGSTRKVRATFGEKLHNLMHHTDNPNENI